MKQLRSIVIGTAGHIDHGKTALVRALTGINTDRLPEEKRRGITIDLGFASMNVVASNGSSLRISFVDVPGHALFIRNMLAGAGCVPAVMLVIAADEGVMPQTREHLAICQLLGMSDGFTVISKADLVDDVQLGRVREQIRNFLKGTFLGNEERPVVGASARTGAGLEVVRTELTKLAMRTKQTESARPVRLPIDRVFVKKGFGTVVTGTLLSGEIRVGQAMRLEPGARIVRVRGLQTHGVSEEVAQAGSRTAVNISSIEVADVSRGQMLVENENVESVDKIDAEIEVLADASVLKHRAQVHLHAFTSEVMATVSLYGSEPVRPGTKRLARLKLSEPVVLVPGDLFVIRQPLPAGTVGGGRVLDTNPLESARRQDTQRWLEQMALAPIPEQIRLRVQRRATNGINLAALSQETGLKADAVHEALADSVRSGALVMVSGEVVVSRAALSIAVEDVLVRLKTAGAAGLKRSVLQSQCGLNDAVLAAVVDIVAAEQKVEIRGESIVTAGAASSISPKESRKLQEVIAAYSKAGLAVPSVKEAAQQLRIEEGEMRRLITLLIREKTLMRMGSEDVLVHAEAIRELTDKLAKMRGKTIDVAAFKTMTGLTRKHAIPLLELLDRERITRKSGDVRIVL